MYPELRETGAAPLDRETKKHIFKNVTGLTVSNLCGIALTSADNILISAFISVGTVGVYGNYLTLKKYIARLMDTLFGSIAAGIGDVCAGEIPHDLVAAQTHERERERRDDRETYRYDREQQRILESLHEEGKILWQEGEIEEVRRGHAGKQVGPPHNTIP